MKAIVKILVLTTLILSASILSACAVDTDSASTDVKADTVLKSTVVYTVASEEPIAGGVAISGDKILAVGSMEELGQYIGEATEVMDMGDQMIMPGFIEGHTHTDVSQNVIGVDLFNIDSQEKAAGRVADFIAQNPDNDFVVGKGWYAAVWGGADPDKKCLDAVAPDIPVVLSDLDEHAMWCNSKALAMAGIDKNFAAEFNKNTPGQLIAVDASGEPTGYLRESGRDQIKAIKPEYTEADLETCINVWPTLGITAVNDMNYDMPDDIIYKQIEDLNSEGKLNVRQFVSLNPEASDEEVVAFKDRFDSDMIRFNAFKILIDGVGATYTASMLKPYEGTTDVGPDPYYTAEQVSDLAVRASKAGLGLHIHTCGTRGVRTALDGYQMAKDGGVVLDPRFSIEHCDTVDPADLTRPAALGISCNVTPDFLAPTPVWEYNPYLAVYDDEVDQDLWRYKSLFSSGANVTFGTDSYASTYNPFVQIYRSLERVTDDGKPEGGFLPEEKFNVKEAIQCYTINGAKAIGMADKLGTLEAGKYADIIVLDHNILTCSSEEIKGTTVVLTMLGGKVVYEKQ